MKITSNTQLTLRGHIIIITGLPGSGKTYLKNSIENIFKGKEELEILDEATEYDLKHLLSKQRQSNMPGLIICTQFEKLYNLLLEGLIDFTVIGCFKENDTHFHTFRSYNVIYPIRHFKIFESIMNIPE